MQPRVSVIMLGVSDLARSRAFYERLDRQTSAELDADVVDGSVVLAPWACRLMAFAL
jgi:catechol 2,3-dioxygenase-like lactoylglutathione lyase family enzyme